MLHSLAVISLLTTAVLAQSSLILFRLRKGSATATASSLVPTGISSACSDALNALNSNTQIQSCLSPMLKASASLAQDSSVSSSDLDTLCSTTTCDDSTIRSALSSISSSCSDELTSNKDVITLYDAPYMLSPFKSALCSKSDSGSYCVLSSSANSSSSSSSSSNNAAEQAQQYLATSSGTVNATTFTSSNVGFLFLSTSSVQCTTCTRNIMTAWINYMSNFPYAPGVANSALFSTQSSVYNAIVQTCGTNFLSGVVKAAGGLGTGSSSSSSNGAIKVVSGATGVMAAIAGAAMAYLL
ncbi:hypothetical protein GYMLUDRAFT_82224 [Collybiopsis luxurians FD-317 M1]|nr:hypothetical protein GYMLUDRAFT_82224 [Collybiopsis luxurians FD-317 M1]